MGKNTIIGAVIGLIVGMVVGFYGANYLNKEQIAAANQTSLQPPAMQGAPNAPQSSGLQTKAMPEVQITLDKAQNNPKDAKAQIEAGDMFLQIERIDEALKYYQKAGEIDPEGLETNLSLPMAAGTPPVENRYQTDQCRMGSL